MIRTSKKLSAFDKEKLLRLQNERRQKYGLRPRKTLHMEDLINLPTDKQGKKEDTPPKKTDGGMYQ